MAILNCFAARLFGVTFLHNAKQGRLLCVVVSTHKSCQRTAHRFDMRAPNPYKASKISDLFPSSWVLQYVFGGKDC